MLRKAGLCRYTRQALSDSFWIKVTTELKKIISLNFDNAMYQATAIFQKSSGSLDWELVS